jgi:hypothetical protein
MLQKLRTTISLRDSNYPINKIVELDEGFFESVDTEKELVRSLKNRFFIL